MTKHVAIIGGGLSGLSAAFDLARAGIEFSLFERSDRFGGAVRSSSRDGFLIEHGADSWVNKGITQKPALDELARDLGIAADIVSSPPISPSTSILRDGCLHPLPPGMRLFVPTDLDAAGASPLFSAETKRRFQQELDLPPRTLPDESIANFVTRHFGSELLDVVAAPLLAGVYGGDANLLSAHAVIPGIVALERHYGSLIRGMKAEQHHQAPASGLFRTFRGGMASLTQALTANLPASSLHPASEVTRVALTADRYRLHLGSGTHDGFTDLIFAVQVPVIERLLAIPLPPTHYSSAVTVALAFDQPPPLPPGFGFLSASGEHSHLRAATFVHQKWPYRVPPGKALLRAFVSGATLLRGSDHEIVNTVRDDFHRILGFNAAPSFACVDRWPHSMPQYLLGHAEQVSHLHHRLRSFKRVYLAGTFIAGVGMPDAVRTGRAAAALILQSQ